jgi:hypothetical protein
MHFYGGVGNFQAVAAEPTADGFILVGDSLPTNDFGIVIIKMDPFGNQVWRKNIPHGTASAIKLVSDGYFIIGDSIKVNQRRDIQVSDIFIRKSRLIKLDVNGLKNFDRSYGDTAIAANKRVDFSGNAIATDGTTLIAVNSVRNNNKNVLSMVTALKLGSSVDTLWSETYDLIDRDYVNSKSAHLTPRGQIIWAATATRTTQNTTTAYIELTVAKQSAKPDNSSPFGQNDILSYYSGNDIQPSGAGYGIVGTFQNNTGGNKNICFVQADIGGNIIRGSEHFFDGVPSDPADANSISIAAANRNSSATNDEGSALTPTVDGGYLLAGTSVTSTARGNGGTDIFIIRIDPFGNVLWNQIIGGSGDESVSTVRQTSDGGFLICGTLSLNGLQSMYILKTDSKGNLQN